jgi:hypothetical protein
MPIFIMVAAIIVAGLTFGAHTAVPGDALYPIKQEVNENVRTWVAVGNAANARSRIGALQHRLREAEQLKDKNTLTGPVRSLLEVEVRTEVESIRGYTSQLLANGDTRAATIIELELKETLRKNTSILTELNPRFNPENLDSFWYLPGFKGVATSTTIYISDPTIEIPPPIRDIDVYY